MDASSGSFQGAIESGDSVIGLWSLIEEKYGAEGVANPEGQAYSNNSKVQPFFITFTEPFHGPLSVAVAL